MSSPEVLSATESRAKSRAFTNNPDELVAFLGRNFQRDVEHCRELAQEILTVSMASVQAEAVVPQPREAVS